MLSRELEVAANIVLASLGTRAVNDLIGEFEWVELKKGAVLIEPGARVEALYFPLSGLGSVVAISPDGTLAEIGLFGRDGVAGLPLILGTDSTPHRVLMQVGGVACRLAASRARALMEADDMLRGALLRYVQAFSVQTAHTALSNARHSIEERLARWLLMSHDRMEGDVVPLTHDFLALMLGVRRPSVTTALHALEGMSLIRATRGLVTIRDRGGLEEFAQDAYGTPEAEFERLIGPLRKGR